jgi:hypothetical protein
VTRLMLPLDQIEEEVQRIGNTLQSLEVAPVEKRQQLEAPIGDEEDFRDDERRSADEGAGRVEKESHMRGDTPMDETTVDGERRGPGAETSRPTQEGAVASLPTQEETTKATDADQVAVDVKEWDSKFIAGFDMARDPATERTALVLRGFLLRAWKRRQSQSFFSWLHQRPEYQSVGLDSTGYVVEPEQLCNPQGGGEPDHLHCQYRWSQMGRTVYCSWWEDRDGRHYKDLEEARDAITRTANCEWWEWSGGSALAHWSWPEWYWEIVRDGLPVWFKEAPKQEWTRPQPAGRNRGEHEQMKAKLGKVWDCRYVSEGEVSSLTSFFAVLKRADDVRMVCNGTRYGLNDAIWVPRFPLPTVNTMLRAGDEHTHLGDMDISEMFLNFVLHESMQSLCGVDLREYLLGR